MKYCFLKFEMERFEMNNQGTHLWHAHAGLQRADGVFGPIVVRFFKIFTKNAYI